MFISFSTKAADKEGVYTIAGMGTSSCASYVEDYKNQYLLLRYMAWANGYLTHLNTVTPGIKDITERVDITARKSWLLKYCKKNTLDNFNTAVKALVKELKKRHW